MAEETKQRPEEMPEYQSKLWQAVIKACREAGQTDEEILSWLETM